MRKKLEEISHKCVFVGYPEGTKGYKLFDLSTKSFIRNRDVIFDEKKLNKFNSKHSSKPSSDFYYPASVADEKDADDQVAVEHVIPVIVRENRNQPVGETHEDTFMQKVQNLNPQREIRPPVRFDEELYAADDLTADINEPRNVSEACKNEYCVQWKEATDAEYNSLIENDTWELVPLFHVACF